ncbi:acyl-CoA dehydrogenase family protein [Streptomyces sp. NPDC004732]|uniref:acyl-CoA dehydrogenase family protein n=1 Tax=Streptomyces sp. NPDC004732 TaxID=3154290 RepID=UPI0033A55354
MTDQSRETEWERLRTAARELAVTFEERSLAHYESGSFVAANIKDLVASGITAMNVPVKHGGFEGTLAENVEILKTIAKGCGSTAFTLSIHAVLTGSLRGEVDSEVSARLSTALLDGAFVVGPFTDENSGSNWVLPSTTAKRDADEFVIDGIKHFSTGCEAATHMVITAGLDDDHLEPPFNLAAFLVPTGDTDKITVKHPWTGFAMPMTGSHSLAIEGVRVSQDDMLLPEGLTPLYVMSRQQWGSYCFTAVFLGLAQRAYEIAVQTTVGRSNNAVGDLAKLPGIQFAVSRMRSSLATMEALLDEYATEHVDPGDDLPAFVADTCVPKYFVTNEAEHVVATAFEVIGGSGIRKGGRIGQIWRDIKAGPLLPLTNDLCREYIGKTVLGIDPLATPRWV